MIKRDLEPHLRELSKKYPVVTLTGPRQAGKSTLCKMVFDNYKYVNLESPEIREQAIEDPKAFLAKLKGGAIIDEIQRAPDLTSYIQVIVDKENKPGQFIITGSEQFSVTMSVNQSLAGRTAVLTLLPFSYSEIYKNKNINIEQVLYTGFYPRIHDKELNPTEALSSYISTYIERDVRQISNLRNLDLFQKFLKLCAANVGQLVNYTRFSNDIGVDQETIKAWISVLKGSYVCYTLQTHHKNFRKKITKTPKLYFYDVGLVSYLLGIRQKEQLDTHPLKGQLFENYVISEIIKSNYNTNAKKDLYFYRDKTGNEVDLIIEQAKGVKALEIKLAQTLTKDKFKGLEHYRKLAKNYLTQSILVYGGKENNEIYNTKVIPYSEIGNLNL